MPRPGPRPYECVKRAWHSERHQPIRGSLIREIFRIANEIHSPATRKNKEWQEKLPSVVFKAEEIMYSKASSEDEYVDLSTLWERVNDAVDTIIRRDDVNESGDLLLPCIEAALTLGCVPRRASRSQRHSNPRYYLSSGAEESRDAAAATSSQKSVIDGCRAQLLDHPFPYSLRPAAGSQLASWLMAADCSPGAMPSEFRLEMRSAAGIQVHPPDRREDSFSMPPVFPRSVSHQLRTGDPGEQASSGRVYPLYYVGGAAPNQSAESSSSVREALGSSIAAGAPGGCSVKARGQGEAAADGGCDLSLHLSLPWAAPRSGGAGADHRTPLVDGGGQLALREAPRIHSIGSAPARPLGRGFPPPRHPQNLEGQNERKGQYLEPPGACCSGKRSLASEDDGDSRDRGHSGLKQRALPGRLFYNNSARHGF